MKLPDRLRPRRRDVKVDLLLHPVPVLATLRSHLQMLRALRRTMLRFQNVTLARVHLSQRLRAVMRLRRRIGHGVALNFGNFWARRGVVRVRNYISFLHLEI